jgi:hypothetical protein
MVIISLLFKYGDFPKIHKKSSYSGDFVGHFVPKKKRSKPCPERA